MHQVAYYYELHFKVLYFWLTLVHLKSLYLSTLMFLQCGFAGEVSCISFHIPESSIDMNTLAQLQVTISAEERGAKEKSPYSPCLYNNIRASPSHVLGLRTGNVIFNYRYYNNKLQRTEGLMQAKLFVLRLSRNSGVLGLAGTASTSQIFCNFSKFDEDLLNNDGILLIRPLLDVVKDDLYKREDQIGQGYVSRMKW